MRNLDTARMLRLVVAGALAGLIIFVIVNPSMVADEQALMDKLRSQLSNMSDPREIIPAIKKLMEGGLLEMTLFSAGFAALLGGLVLLADEIGSPLKRVLLRVLIGTLSGAVVGGVAGFAAQVAFSRLIQINLIFLIPARIIGWTVLGLGAGASIGIAASSWPRLRMGITGGLIGGAIGGGLFDMIGVVAMNGSASRFVGFIAMGAAVGAAICFVEEAAKRNWVTILSGPREGKSYILTKPVTGIGRDELADIPLFGDVSVAKLHVQLMMTDGMVSLQSASGQPVPVNGVPMQTAQLCNADTFRIGRFALRFHQKATQYAHVAYQPQATMYSPGQSVLIQATGALALTVVAGPYAGHSSQFGPGSIRIGRDAGCAVLLAQDTMSSRMHADITWDGSNWVLADLNARNGTWVNGTRITSHALMPGDQVGIGQTVMRVDSV